MTGPTAADLEAQRARIKALAAALPRASEQDIARLSRLLAAIKLRQIRQQALDQGGQP